MMANTPPPGPRPGSPIYMTGEQRARFLQRAGLPLGWHLVTTAELALLDQQTKIYAAERPALIEKAWRMKDALRLAMQDVDDIGIEQANKDWQTIKEAAEIPLPMRPPAGQPPEKNLESGPAGETLEAWQKREAQVLEALQDGLPNPEGYMEWWYAKNPKPKATGGTP